MDDHEDQQSKCDELPYRPGSIVSRSASFHTEIGWAIIVEGRALWTRFCLINHPPKWALYRTLGAPPGALKPDHLGDARPDGLPRAEALRRFSCTWDIETCAVTSRTLRHWLRIAGGDAVISLGGRKLGDAKKLIETDGLGP